MTRDQSRGPFVALDKGRGGEDCPPRNAPRGPSPVRMRPLLFAFTLLLAPAGAQADLLYVLNSGEASISVVEPASR